jgi:hypothetical protein
VGHVPIRFNRMVVLKGSVLYHRATSRFGTTVEDGRLLQRYFFNTQP